MWQSGQFGAGFGGHFGAHTHSPFGHHQGYHQSFPTAPTLGGFGPFGYSAAAPPPPIGVGYDTQAFGGVQAFGGTQAFGGFDTFGGAQFCGVTPAAPAAASCVFGPGAPPAAPAGGASGAEAIEEEPTPVAASPPAAAPPATSPPRAAGAWGAVPPAEPATAVPPPAPPAPAPPAASKPVPAPAAEVEEEPQLVVSGRGSVPRAARGDDNAWDGVAEIAPLQSARRTAGADSGGHLTIASTVASQRGRPSASFASTSSRWTALYPKASVPPVPEQPHTHVPFGSSLPNPTRAAFSVRTKRWAADEKRTFLLV